MVIDDFLPEAEAHILAGFFPRLDAIQWKEKTHEHGKKLTSSRKETMSPAIRNFLLQRNSSTFVTFLVMVAASVPL